MENKKIIWVEEEVKNKLKILAIKENLSLNKFLEKIS
jgi:predicted HicB family RNase H-like nuclease